MNTITMRFAALLSGLACCLAANLVADETAANGDPFQDRSTYQINEVNWSGAVADGKGGFQITGVLQPGDSNALKPLYRSHLDVFMEVKREKLSQVVDLNVHVFQGRLEQIVVDLTGSGQVDRVEGEWLDHWSIKRTKGDQRQLVLHLKSMEGKQDAGFRIHATSMLSEIPIILQPLNFQMKEAAFVGGLVVLGWDEGLTLKSDVDGLLLMASSDGVLKPEDTASDDGHSMMFNILESNYVIGLEVGQADPDANLIAMRDFNLAGELKENSIAFQLTGTVEVRPEAGGHLDLLDDSVALTGSELPEGVRLFLEGNQFRLGFDGIGHYPIAIQFEVPVRVSNQWNQVNFDLVSSVFRQVSLTGIDTDSRIEINGATRRRVESEPLNLHFSSTGPLELRWQDAQPESEAELFFSVTGFHEIHVSPGLTRQEHRLDYQIMQGEMKEVTVRLRGSGQVTQVIAQDLLSWEVNATDQDERLLILRFNQARTGAFRLVLHTQATLESLPQSFEPLVVEPENAIRYGGHIRLGTLGAVRVESTETLGLTQVSPEIVERSGNPIENAVKVIYAARFSGPGFAIELAAEEIVPEIAVAQILVYHLAESERVIDLEMEIEIREAPLRELRVTLPSGYMIASVEFPYLADHVTREQEGETGELDWILTFRQPLFGKQILKARLEKNEQAVQGSWTIPKITVQGAKSVRGQIGLTADQGYRLTLSGATGLTELATAYFPKKLSGMQIAFRLRDLDWNLVMDIASLPLSVQVETLHLFSAGEGSLYGSSLMNYYVVGSPVSSVKLSLSSDYQNVEFHGEGLRGWQNTNDIWEVRFQSPVSGAFTILANYEKKLTTATQELDLSGCMAMDAQSEQGYVMLVSSHPYEVGSNSLPDSLIQLEQAELPEAYRMLADAPILASFQYVSRPFSLPMTLRRMAPGETRDILVDRAHVETRVSRDGQVLSECRYFIKSSGHSHFKLSYQPGQVLWSAEVAGEKVVPVKDANDELIPLPLDSGSDKSVEVKLVLASAASDASRLRVDLPRISAPVLLTEWNLTPDSGQRLDFVDGVSMPRDQRPSITTYDWLYERLKGDKAQRELALLGTAQCLILLALGLWKWITSQTNRNRAKYYSGLIIGLAATLLAGLIWIHLIRHATLFTSLSQPGLQLLLPVMPSMEPAYVECLNKSMETGTFSSIITIFPAWFGVLLWGYAVFTAAGWKRRVAILAGWFMWIWAGLNLEYGLPFFLGTLGCFILLHSLLPSLKSTWNYRHQLGPQQPGNGSTVTGSIGLIALCIFLGTYRTTVPASEVSNQAPPYAFDIHQDIRSTTNRLVESETTLTWHAEKGDALPLLRAPGVMTEFTSQPDSTLLIQDIRDGVPWQVVRATETGVYQIHLRYHMPLNTSQGDADFHIPLCAGLKHTIRLTLPGPDFQVHSPQAVSIKLIDEPESTNPVYRLVLPPKPSIRIGWKPKQRDTSLEDSLFYARWYHVLLPLDGIVEAAHVLELNLTQGQIQSLNIQIPESLTVTDVFSDQLRHWRYDPGEKLLAVEFNDVVSTKVNLLIKAQGSGGNLPYTTTIALPEIGQAANELGFVGVASNAEIDIESVTAESWERVNLDDFPAHGPWSGLEAFKSAEIHRAFRFSSPDGDVTFSASAVEPDIRLQNRVTLSMGEDRVLLASQMQLNINRTGVFKLTFPVPANMDVEALTGSSVSHWTEMKSETNRVVTVHFSGRTEGAQTLNTTLAGPGITATNAWLVPRLLIPEATRQTDEITLYPERGFRFQVNERQGVTEINPDVAGSAGKGVLAFRFLNQESYLSMAVENVEPWVQAAFLQLSRIQEGQHKVRVLFDYNIDNTGLREVLIDLPGEAEGVRFTGHQIEDAVRETRDVTTARDIWRVRFARRMAGMLRFEVAYHEKMNPQLEAFTIRTVDLADANLKRGFINLHAVGRLGMTLPDQVTDLQKIDWQSLPSTLREGRSVGEGFFTFRMNEPPVDLPVKLVRREVVRLLSAELTQAHFLTLISETGQSFTQVDLKILPGNKRSLMINLPSGGQFWYGQVDDQVVQPWKAGGNLHLPLDKAKAGGESDIRFFYSESNIQHRRNWMEGNLIGPAFDLPVKHVGWTIRMSKGWQLASWDGGLELKETQSQGGGEIYSGGMNVYLQKEQERQKMQSLQAEAFLSQGNEFLQSGANEKARQAFEAAKNLSIHDAAFNEDARVQLQNVKKQQAVFGLNALRNNMFNNFAVQSDLPQGQLAAQQATEPGSAVQSVLDRLAERLVQHQGSAGVFQQGMHIDTPVLGNEWLFTRSLMVDASKPLTLNIEAERPSSKGLMARGMILTLFFLFMIVVYTVRRFITGPGFLESEDSKPISC